VKKKVAIVGAGVWGRTHAFLYKEHPEVELVAISDQNIERAKKFADEFGIPRVFVDHRTMLDRRDFDAVSIVTPDFAHGAIVVDCANTRKDILVEKPNATTRESLIRISEVVSENNVRIMTDLHNRWSPPFAGAKRFCLLTDNVVFTATSGFFLLSAKRILGPSRC